MKALIITLLFTVVLLYACNNNNSVTIPFESSLDSAVIHQKQLIQLENSILIGNGDINGLIYSIEGNINISLTKNNVWDGRMITKDDPPLFKVDLKNRKWSGGAPEYTVPPSYSDYASPCPIYCALISIGKKEKPLTALSVSNNFMKGDLKVKINNSLQKIPVTSTLDLKKGLACIEKGIHNPEVKVRALAQKNVFLIESVEEISLLPNGIIFIPTPKQGNKEGVEYLFYKIPGDIDWPGMEYAVAKCSSGETTVVAIVTSGESKNCLQDAITVAKETLKEPANKLIGKHEAIWRKFWSLSGVKLGDEFFNNAWYRNLYFMRCISNTGVMSAALLAGLEPMENFSGVAWKGNLTLDYNAEQMYWAWYSANHPELSEPYENTIINYLPRAQWFARETFNCEGAFFPVNVYMYEPSNMEKLNSVNKRMTAYVPWTYVSALAGWVVQNLWLHYKYYPENNLLKNKLYQPLKEVALFYLDFLSQCEKDKNGKAIIGPSYSPEHGNFGVYQVTADITFMRMMFKIMIECNEILKFDYTFAEQCSHALKTLPAFPVSTGKQPVVLDYENSITEVFNVPVPVLPVYPVGEINYFSPEKTKTLFKNTIDSIKWNGNNGVVTLSVARARLSMPNTNEWVKANFLKRLRANGTFSLNQLTDKPSFNDLGHYSEQFAFTGIVNEMLVQNNNGIMRFFPAWDKRFDASFNKLRTDGGFEVSANLEKGKVNEIQINSTAGGKFCFLNLWENNPVLTINGKKVKAKDEGNALFSVITNVGDNIEITH